MSGILSARHDAVGRPRRSRRSLACAWTAPSDFDTVTLVPAPLAICLEDLAPSSRSERYLRCVALAGRQPGLRLAPDGTVAWRGDGDVGGELWVSLDDRLILLRPAGAPSVVVRRAGRSLDVPFDKPVVVIDQDVVEIGPKRMRLHVHGEAAEVTAPSYLPERTAPSAARLAAVVAMGAAVAGCKGTGSRDQAPSGTPPIDTAIEVREHPPEEAPRPKTTTTTEPATTAPPPTTAAPTQTKPIEVRDTPPAAPIPKKPPTGSTGPSPR
jgi:hypothetical protein